MLCAFLVLFLSGVWFSDMAMASLISSSLSIHAFADAASVVRSCVDNWSTVSFVGIVDIEMEETAMASPISSSVAFHASADAVSVARSCMDNWFNVSSVGVVEGVMSLLRVGGGGVCVCCGGGNGGG